MINELWLTRVEACWQRGAPATARRTYVQINRSINLSSLHFLFLSLFFCPFPSSAIYFSHSIYIHIEASGFLYVNARVSFRTTASNRLPFSVRRAKELAITTTTHVAADGRARAAATCAGQEQARVMKRAGNERRVHASRHASSSTSVGSRQRLPGPFVPPRSRLVRSLARSFSGDSFVYRKIVVIVVDRARRDGGSPRDLQHRGTSPSRVM